MSLGFSQTIDLLIDVGTKQNPLVTMKDVKTLGALADTLKANGVGAVAKMTVQSLGEDLDAVIRSATLLKNMLMDPDDAGDALALIQQLAAAFAPAK